MNKYPGSRFAFFEERQSRTGVEGRRRSLIPGESLTIFI